MNEDGPLDAVGSFHDAAAGSTPWDEAGARLRRAIGAQTATLWVGDPGLSRVETLHGSAVPDGAVAPHLTRFYTLEPWVTTVVSRTDRDGGLQAHLGPETVPSRQDITIHRERR